MTKSVKIFVTANYYIQLITLASIALGMVVSAFLEAPDLALTLFYVWMSFGFWQVLSALVYTLDHKGDEYRYYLRALLAIVVLIGPLCFIGKSGIGIVLLVLLFAPIVFAIANFAITTKLYFAAKQKRAVDTSLLATPLLPSQPLLSDCDAESSLDMCQQ